MNIAVIVEQEKKWLLDEKYKGVVSDKYKKECLLLEKGMPVAYLIGNIDFLGCCIDLEYKPLIPRPETEYWVDIVIKKILNSDCDLKGRNLRVLDLFAGSGCIGIACAKHLPHAHVDFGEINPNNIKQIKKNLNINNIKPIRCCIYESDVFTSISVEKYDYILANPPYISEDRDDTVQKSVLNNEDHLALFAKDDGLQYVYRLIDEAAEYLKPGGSMYIEFDPWQTDLINNKLAGNKYWSHRYLQDQYKKNRVLVLVKIEKMQ